MIDSWTMEPSDFSELRIQQTKRESKMDEETDLVRQVLGCFYWLEFDILQKRNGFHPHTHTEQCRKEYFDSVVSAMRGQTFFFFL